MGFAGAAIKGRSRECTNRLTLLWAGIPEPGKAFRCIGGFGKSRSESKTSCLQAMAACAAPLEDYARGLKGEDRVQFPGKIPSDEMLKCYLQTCTVEDMTPSLRKSLVVRGRVTWASSCPIRRGSLFCHKNRNRRTSTPPFCSGIRCSKRL